MPTSAEWLRRFHKKPLRIKALLMADEAQVQALAAEAQALSVEIQRLGNGKLLAAIRALIALASKIDADLLADIVTAITSLIANPANVAAWIQLAKLIGSLLGGGSEPAPAE